MSNEDNLREIIDLLLYDDNYMNVSKQKIVREVIQRYLPEDPKPTLDPAIYMRDHFIEAVEHKISILEEQEKVASLHVDDQGINPSEKRKSEELQTKIMNLRQAITRKDIFLDRLETLVQEAIRES
jgi:hypothetical protein